MELRKAIDSDIDWLVEQAKEFAKFYGSTKLLVDDINFSKEYIAGIIKHHFFKIAEKDGVRLGFIAGLVVPHHFNPKIKMLHELLWWVPEIHRSTKAGSILLDDFIAYGKEHCDWITFTLEDNTPIDDSVLLRRGFRMKEKSYLLETNKWPR